MKNPPTAVGGIRRVGLFCLGRLYMKNPPTAGVTPASETVAIFTHWV